MESPRFYPKSLSVGQQIYAMRSYYPSFNYVHVGNRVVWTGQLHPTPMSAVYTVKIRYYLGHSPEVWVISPKLVTRQGGDKIPHVYPDKSLCLYLPRTGEWSSRKLIAETIVPWTSLWLYYYEMWHTTGKWLGGGVHPSAQKEEQDSDV